MRYISTRGGAPAVGFTEALLAGLAPDGGLYTPEAWPRLDASTLERLQSAPYAEAAAMVFGLFAGAELGPEALLEDCRSAYGRFSHPAVAPLRQLKQNLWMLELFHGPTLAFKDVAMQILARLYDRALAQRGGRLTIVCATSGDTGGAAVEAFRGSDRVRIVALYPKGRISEVQRRFMTAACEPNVLCLALDGDFDDCQAILKALFADDEFSQTVALSGVNSINIARIIAQSVYYLTSGAALGAPGRSLAFAVPTGNFGDAFAAYAAWRMGAPISGVRIATNANDILVRTLVTGRYARGRAVATQSPAMDIQVASNFERLYFEAVGRDAAETAGAFADFAREGALVLPSQALEHIRTLFSGDAVGEERTSDAMRSAFRDDGILVDPHTAVALAAGRGPIDPAAPLVVLSTAHAAKFPDAVEAAAGARPALPPRSLDLFSRQERMEALPADLEAVKSRIRAFAAA